MSECESGDVEIEADQDLELVSVLLISVFFFGVWIHFFFLGGWGGGEGVRVRVRVEEEGALERFDLILCRLGFSFESLVNLNQHTHPYIFITERLFV